MNEYHKMIQYTIFISILNAWNGVIKPETLLDHYHSQGQALQLKSTLYNPNDYNIDPLSILF